jgi:hypothetical protein
MPTQEELVMRARKTLFKKSATTKTKKQKTQAPSRLDNLTPQQKQSVFNTVTTELLTFPTKSFIIHVTTPFKPENWTTRLALTAISTITLDHINKLTITLDPTLTRLQLQIRTNKPGIQLLEHIRKSSILNNRRHKTFLNTSINLLKLKQIDTNETGKYFDLLRYIIAMNHLPKSVLQKIKTRLWYLTQIIPPPIHTITPQAIMRDQVLILIGQIYNHLTYEDRIRIAEQLRERLYLRYLSDSERKKIEQLIKRYNMR